MSTSSARWPVGLSRAVLDAESGEKAGIHAGKNNKSPKSGVRHITGLPAGLPLDPYSVR